MSCRLAILSVSLVPLLTLGACDPDKGNDTGHLTPVDEDGDGYFSAQTGGDDCDDADPAIHPGATEECDGIDNDCDDLVDMDDSEVVGWDTWFVDSDGDGYGSEDERADGCTQPDGTSEVGGDCDDRDADINPDAYEMCDGVDNDCDGAVDSDDDDVLDERTAYEDADGDGYGNPDVSMTACDLPDDYVSNADDCDDTDADVYPGAEEGCGDGVDADCDGWDGPPTIGAESALDCAQGSLRPSDALAMGGVVVGLGDTNGDAAPDFAVGSQGGQAWVVLGPVTGPDIDLWAAGTLQDPSRSGDAGTGFGSVLAPVGDLDGDGLADLGVGAPQSDPLREDEGMAYVFMGPVTGTLSPDDAAVTVTGGTFDAWLGGGMGGADLDGDGVVDLLLGAPQLLAQSDRTGAVYLFQGPVTGSLTVDDASAVFLGGRSSYWLGASVISVGDTDGDGYEDVLAAAPKDDKDGEDAGAVFVLSGPVSAGSWSDSVRLLGVAAGDGAGTSIAALGDVDGDGYADILVGAPDNDDVGQAAGAVYMVLGPMTSETTLATADATLTGQQQADNLGQSVSLAADMDGDGADEWLLGAPREGWDPGPGAAWVVAGPVTGQHSVNDVGYALWGETDGDQAGYGVTDVGDLDGSGVDDLVVGAPGLDDGVGGVYLVLVGP